MKRTVAGPSLGFGRSFSSPRISHPGGGGGGALHGCGMWQWRVARSGRGREETGAVQLLSSLEGRLQAEGRRKALSPSRRVEFLLGACFFDDDEDFSPFPLPVPSLVFISYIIYLLFGPATSIENHQINTESRELEILYGSITQKFWINIYTDFGLGIVLRVHNTNSAVSIRILHSNSNR